MKTFSITTLGCRVNHYESEQLATLLRGRGLVQAPPGQGDVRVVHTCSVTVQAASKSRQSVRRATRLAVLPSTAVGGSCADDEGVTDPIAAVAQATGLSLSGEPSVPNDIVETARRAKVIVTGCWATSHPEEAAALRGVDAVLGHHQDVDQELSRLLTQWQTEAERPGLPTSPGCVAAESQTHAGSTLPKPILNDGWMIQQAGTSAGLITSANEPHVGFEVNGKLEGDENPCEEVHEVGASRTARLRGMTTLPQLGERQTGHQRAFLKVQDGCDAHCTYCIIPQLRPRLWSKSIDDAVDEARRLVDAGHVEIVLTGIFLGAYGQPTALRRRQSMSAAEPLGRLVEALCARVSGLGRLRLSSLEPGDLTEDLLKVLKGSPRVVPHFHLPLQSGSDRLLRRMNRQYGREDFLELAERVKEAFDRPAITTDIIVGFPGENDEEFERTVEVVRRVGFLHIHAFSYSLRPKTAAARWTKEHVRGPIVNERIERLGAMAMESSRAFRESFVGETVEVLVERASSEEREMELMAGYQHGRCERYFAVHFQSEGLPPGTLARVRVDRVTPTRTFGTLLEGGR
jgi:threonylcarbamoyladenosine tRNA methylthiotransferase MtaB